MKKYVFIFVCFVALFAWWFVFFPQPIQYREWEAICAQYPQYEVISSPPVEGSLRNLGAICFGAGQKIAGTFSNNGKAITIASETDSNQSTIVIFVENKEKNMSYGVLKSKGFDIHHSSPLDQNTSP